MAARIENGLRAAGEPGRAEQEQRYLKSSLEHYGASVPAIRRVTKATLAADPAPWPRRARELCGALWARPVHEWRMAAVELLDLYSGLLRPDDIELVERLIRQSKTWALVDGLAASVAGLLIKDYRSSRGR